VATVTLTQNKKQLGQFFTARADYILNGLARYVRGKVIVDPFAGSGDLLNWAEENGAKSVKGFDIDPNLTKGPRISINDSLLKPGQYKFVITNPPYLNVNKADTRTKERYFSKREFEDLYQLSLRSIMNSEEGIVIVPINFLSAYNARSIRDLFFSKFEIDRMSYFREQVFPDTTYNVIAFHYRKRRVQNLGSFTISAKIFPGKESISITLNQLTHWTIGGDIYERITDQKNILRIQRLEERHIEENQGNVALRGAHNHIKTPWTGKVSKEFAQKVKSNIMLLRAIDGGSEHSRMGLDNIRDHNIDCLVSKTTSRHMIHLIMEQQISIGEQEKLIGLFNKELEVMREKHFSLFLTNYRDNDRKRISFDFVYKLLNYLYEQHIASSGKLPFSYEPMGRTKYQTRERTRISR